MILSLVLSGFLFFGRIFIDFWAGHGYSQSFFVTLLLIVPVTVPLIQNLGIEIQRAKNKHKIRSIVYFFVAIGNVFVSIPLIKMYGPIGAAMGTAAALIVGNIIFMNWYYHMHLGIDIIKFWKKIVKIIPSMLLPFIVGVLFSRVVKIENIITFVICALLYTIIFSVCLWMWGMNKYEKQSIKNLLGKFKRNNR